MSLTTYRILTQNGDGSWQEQGSVEAHGARAARRIHAEKHGGEVVVNAIPEVSWQPKLLVPEPKPRLVERDPDPPQKP